MIKEDYVSFEVAKLLKEKGFSEITLDSYRANGQLRGEYKSCNIPCPTHQMAMRWLREEKHYYIQIMLDSWALGGHSGYYIVIQDVNSDFSECSPTEQVFFETHEDAVEAALKYCLEKLI